MNEARDMLLAAGTISEAVRDLRRTIEEAKEERQQLDWAVQRLREERMAVQATIEEFLRMSGRSTRPMTATPPPQRDAAGERAELARLAALLHKHRLNCVNLPVCGPRFHDFDADNLIAAGVRLTAAEPLPSEGLREALAPTTAERELRALAKDATPYIGLYANIDGRIQHVMLDSLNEMFAALDRARAALATQAATPAEAES